MSKLFNQLAFFLIVFQIALFFVWNSSIKHDKRSFRKRSNISDKDSIEVVERRIAVLIPYFGEHLPLWFNTFAMSASSSNSIIDWFIFVTDAPLRSVPSNVKLIKLSRQEVYRRFSTLADQTQVASDSIFIQNAFQRLFDDHPYVLVEFKSCLGYIFHDYIDSYSHWGYADMDMLAGRIDQQVSLQHLQLFDVISFSFGDNYRLYLRGQLTILRNTERIINLWRDCPHLKDIGNRLRLVYGNTTTASAHKQSVVPDKWRFQSAEGCISKVVMDTNNLTVLFISSQLSDAFRGTRAEKESLLFSRALIRCYESGLHLTADSADSTYSGNIAQYMRRSDTRPSEEELHIFEGNRLTDHDKHSNTLHRVVGTCSYWIEPQYDVCVSEVPAIANVYKDTNGVISYHTVNSYQVAQSDCREASISHFQAWKRHYYAFTTRQPSADTHVMLITETGFIPLRLDMSVNRPELQTVPLFNEHFAQSELRLGRMLPGAIIPTEQNHGEDFVSNYCAIYAENLKYCECYIMINDIHVILKTSMKSKDNDITLIAVGWEADFLDEQLQLNWMLQNWDGPKVIVLASITLPRRSELKYLLSDISDLTIIVVNLLECMQYLSTTEAIGESSSAFRLPDKTLYNIALDAVNTDLVMLMPVELTKLSARLVTQQSTTTLSEVQNKPTTALLKLLTVINKQLSLRRRDDKESAYNPIAAIVFPVFDALQSALKPHQFECAAQQPDSLRLEYDHTSTNDIISPVQFNAVELLQQHTAMLPILFNMSACPHGRDFVRFPEEMNGQGCFGVAILRILAGSGYALHWSNSVAHIEVLYLNKSRKGLDPIEKTTSDCGCISIADYTDSVVDSTKPLNEMAVRLNSYYLRAVELRTNGIQSVHTGMKYGESFERNTKRR